MLGERLSQSLPSNPRSPIAEAETDDKGRLTGKTAMRMDPFDQKRDERAFWSALVPILQSKRLQMEPVWPVLQRLTREGVAQSKAVAKVGCRVTIAPRWFEAAGVGQLGCLAPGVSGTVVHVMMHKSLPVVVKSDTNGAYWFYKTAELVGAGLGLESRGDFLPGMVGEGAGSLACAWVVAAEDGERDTDAWSGTLVVARLFPTMSSPFTTRLLLTILYSRSALHHPWQPIPSSPQCASLFLSPSQCAPSLLSPPPSSPTSG